jgi:DNA mismatch repair ATPase MutS
MDEVGRGTTVKDGLAIAFATVHHLVSKNRCRALFATHFHELSDMLGCSESQKGSGSFEDVAFFCTDVDETEVSSLLWVHQEGDEMIWCQDGHFSYSYRVQPGVNRDSHGLKVAQLAGMPKSAMSVAQNTLLALKSQNNSEILPAVQLAALGRSLVQPT